MTLEKATVVDFNKRSVFIADHIRLKTVLELNVRCLAIGADVNTIHGIINTLATSTFTGNKPLREDITINGKSFGNGYVQSISADPDGTDTQAKYYNINIIIEYPGYLNKIFTQIANENTKLIESISENLSFSQEKNNKNFSHQVDIQMNPDLKTDAFTKCQELKNAICADLNNIQKLISFGNVNYTFDRDVTKFPTIEYDSQSCKYTYTESWEKHDNIGTTAFTSAVLGSKTIRGEVREDGIINITVSLEGTSNEEPQNYDNVKSFITNQEPNLYTDASNLYNKIKSKSSTSTLKNIPLSKNYIASKNEFKYGVSLVFTDDINLNVTNKTISEITHTQIYEDAATVVSEEGTVYSLEQLDTLIQTIDAATNKRYTSVKTAFTSEKPNIKQRCTNFANTFINKNLLSNTVFKLIYYSESHSYSDGTIKYTYRYSNNPSIKYSDETDTYTVFRKEVEEKKLEPEAITLSSVFTDIGNDKYQILQTSKNNNFENITYQKTANISSAKKFKDVLSLIPTANSTADSFVNNVEITYSSQSREVTYSTSIMKVRTGSSSSS